MQESWVLYGLLSSIPLAGFLLVNQYYKVSGQIIILWARAIVAIIILPFVLLGYIQIYTDLYFCLIVFIASLLGMYGDIKCLDLAAKHGGGLVSRISPIIVLISFVIWIFIEPNSILKYQDEPIHIIGILLSIMGCIYFSMRLNKCQVTKSAFIFLLPALIALSMANILNKQAMSMAEINIAAYSYVFLQSLFIVFITIFYNVFLKRVKIEKDVFFSYNSFKVGLIIAILLSSGSILKNYSMSFVDNPGYFAALMLLVPIYILLFYKFINHKEYSDVKSSMGVVASILILILATS